MITTCVLFANFPVEPVHHQPRINEGQVDDTGLASAPRISSHLIEKVVTSTYPDGCLTGSVLYPIRFAEIPKLLADDGNVSLCFRHLLEQQILHSLAVLQIYLQNLNH